MRLTKMLRDLLLCALIFLFLGLIVVRLSGNPEDKISGRPRIVDGDTLVLSGARLRIAGMDAPELAQMCTRDGGSWPCGALSRAMLRDMAGAGEIVCLVSGRDRYGRSLATCTAGSQDIGAAMVREGYAVAFGNYETEEDMARRERLGLWSGSFDRPRTWRETHGGMNEAPHISGGWLTTLWSRIWNE